MSKAKKVLLAAAATGLAAATLGALPAEADNVGGGTGAGGPYVTARISFSGDVKGGGGTRSVSVPATCWWEPLDVNFNLGNPPVDPDDPASVQAMFDEMAPFLSGHAAGGRLELPTGEYMADIARRVAAGEKLSFYHAECVDGKNPVDEGLTDLAGTWQGVNFGVTFRAFPPGNPAPPIVAAETLAQEALKVLYIENPTVDRNPKIGLGGTDAALVTLPTYFWVTNVGDALGTPVGHKEVVATAGNAQATLIADSSGVGITSDGRALEGGGKECTPEQITHRYSEGAAEGDLCSVKFARSSAAAPGGAWGVTVASHWDVSWSGVEANGDANPGGPLALLNPTQSTINVPVAESQAVVNGTNS